MRCKLNIIWDFQDISSFWEAFPSKSSLLPCCLEWGCSVWQLGGLEGKHHTLRRAKHKVKSLGPLSHHRATTSALVNFLHMSLRWEKKLSYLRHCYLDFFCHTQWNLNLNWQSPLYSNLMSTTFVSQDFIHFIWHLSSKDKLLQITDVKGLKVYSFFCQISKFWTIFHRQYYMKIVFTEINNKGK
jgi:hypothetical protein